MIESTTGVCVCPFTDQTYILELNVVLPTSVFRCTIYNQFLRANYKEFGLKSTLLLVAILKLFASLNAMAGNSVGVEDCEIHVHDSSLPCTSSQDNVGSSLDIVSTIQRATRLVVQIYHKLFSLSKNNFIEALHDCGSIQELRCVRDLIFATVRRRRNLSKAGHLINRTNNDNLKEKLIKDISTLFTFGEGTVKSMPKSLLKPPDLANAETQTDVVCDLNQTYATKSELDTVKEMFLDEISNLKNLITHSITSMTISDSLPVSPSLVSPFPSASNAANTSHLR